MSYRKEITEKSIREYLKRIQPLREAFDFIDSPTIITDPNGNILYANKAVEKNTGFSADEILTKNPGDIWGGNMPDSFYAEMWDTIKNKKQPFVGEVKNLNKKKEVYWQEIRITPILDDTGEVAFFLGIQPNITPRKHQESLKNEFVSVIGHQLKSPVAATSWALEFLRQGQGLPAKQQIVLKEMYEKNQGLKKLISDLLLVAQAQDISGVLKKEEVDLIKIVEDTANLVQLRFKNIKIKFSKPVGSFKIKSNSGLAKQIFFNIIENAAYYSDKKDSVIKIGIKKEKDGILFSCQDNGIGIATTDKSKIFEKFFRTSKAKALRPNGNGMGLFIVKLIAENFGWNISFTSKPHKGTTFFIKIPN